MSREKPETSAALRLLRLSALAGRVGASLALERARRGALIGGDHDAARIDVFVRNAARVVETLGELKGAAMKVGQMLSLHEGLLPAEVTEALRGLQRDAPPIPFEVIEEELDVQIPAHRTIFASIEHEAFAAASIGQVHRGVLRDGRAVAIKIQYPEIGRVVRADLANLRRVLGRIFALVSKMDFDPVWNEVRNGLIEELDYRQEASHLTRFRELHREDDRILVPRVIEEASTRTILTMEYLAGLPPERAIDPATPQSLRDAWGHALFDLTLAGVFRDRLLHADPNLANFAFREDGRVIVYDLGCVKRVPLSLARGYAKLVLAVADDRPEDVPPLLAELGVLHTDGAPVPRTMTDAYAALFHEIAREDPPFHFGPDTGIYQRLFDLGIENAGHAASLRFPEDVVFVNRTLAGLLGNLTRLRARGPWRASILAAAARAPDALPDA